MIFKLLFLCFGLTICISLGLMISNEIDNKVNEALDPWPIIEDDDVLLFEDDHLWHAMPVLEWEQATQPPIPVLQWEYDSITCITFYFEGKEAVINYSGGSITYTGELPVEESAKLFFKAYGNLCGISQ